MKDIYVSVIITAHAESILTHRTLLGVRRALDFLAAKKPHIQKEIILHADNPTPETLSYIKTNKNTSLKDVRMFMNSFGDLGESRNFAIKQAKGKYIATIDADDIMSKQWLYQATKVLDISTEPSVAHSEFTIEFEGANSLIIKHGEIDYDTDTLLSVYANRWNSVIVAPRKLLLGYPYHPNSPGYGYEDWHLNSRLIQARVHNVLIPETAIFVRRKKSNSEWARQIQSMAVLRKNPLLGFGNIRGISNVFQEYLPTENEIPTPRSIYSLSRRLVAKYPLTHRVARTMYRAIKRSPITYDSPPIIKSWLVDEWSELHQIDKNIFLSDNLKSSIPVYDTITLEHKITGAAYKKIVDSLRHDSYDYMIIVPWLAKGGADRYAINYANHIQNMRKNKRVLVVATLPYPSPWQNELSDGVDFIDFGNITREARPDIKHRLMEHIVENAEVSCIHIINSEFGYDFVNLHKTYIKASDVKVVITSFSQSTDESGRVFGYSHTHVPEIYDLANVITSDNQTVLDMWVKDYGFDKNKLKLHRQPITASSSQAFSTTTRSLVLWAARVAPEKQPELIGEIAKYLPDNIEIHMYGNIEQSCEHAIKDLPTNAHYKGPFDGLNTLPLSDYDCLLYTSLFDGMPNTILEAASAGLPIISSNVGGIHEVIENNKTGVLIDDIRKPEEYAAAITQLVKNPALREKYSTAMHEKLRREFSTKGYYSGVSDMLRELGY